MLNKGTDGAGRDMKRISAGQFRLLSLFAEHGSGWMMRAKDAARYDQRPFRSVLRRGWVVQNHRGFTLTSEGRKAWREFSIPLQKNSKILRKYPKMPMTAAFDPAAMADAEE